MTRDNITPLAPALSRKRSAPAAGREPSLSKEHRPARTATVATLIEQLRSAIIHDRFNATLALAAYPDHNRAVAAIIRSARDDSRLVRLAALFALHEIGPRLGSAMLRAHAIRVLGCALRDGETLVIPSVALQVLLMERSQEKIAARRVLLDALSHLPDESGPREAWLSRLAADALRCIGTPEALATLDTWHASDGLSSTALS